MAKIEGEVFCDNCGAQILWSPLVSAHKDTRTGRISRREYCCQDCMQDQGCRCGERMEINDERRQGGSIVAGEVVLGGG